MERVGEGDWLIVFEAVALADLLGLVLLDLDGDLVALDEGVGVVEVVGSGVPPTEAETDADSVVEAVMEIDGVKEGLLEAEAGTRTAPLTREAGQVERER